MLVGPEVIAEAVQGWSYSWRTVTSPVMRYARSVPYPWHGSTP